MIRPVIRPVIAPVIGPIIRPVTDPAIAPVTARITPRVSRGMRLPAHNHHALALLDRVSALPSQPVVIDVLRDTSSDFRDWRFAVSPK